ncbi:hypothetical protein ACSTCJ_24185, partial [Klebsiella pneumoniae]
MQALKIAVIGGGSSYTPELIEGIIVRYEQLPVTELALLDVESGREKVEIIAALTRRMLKHKGLEQVAVSVHFTLDEAIRGASFVLTQLRVGQLAARPPPVGRGGKEPRRGPGAPRGRGGVAGGDKKKTRPP